MSIEEMNRMISSLIFLLSEKIQEHKLLKEQYELLKAECEKLRNAQT